MAYTFWTVTSMLSAVGRPFLHNNICDRKVLLLGAAPAVATCCVPCSGNSLKPGQTTEYPSWGVSCIHSVPSRRRWERCNLTASIQFESHPECSYSVSNIFWFISTSPGKCTWFVFFNRHDRVLSHPYLGLLAPYNPFSISMNALGTPHINDKCYVCSNNPAHVLWYQTLIVGRRNLPLILSLFLLYYYYILLYNNLPPYSGSYIHRVNVHVYTKCNRQNTTMWIK